MNCIDIQEINDTRDLVVLVQNEDNPIIAFDGEDECLVAMRPAVFERILFEGDLLNSTERVTLRF